MLLQTLPKSNISWHRRVAILAVALHVGGLSWIALTESPTWQEPAQLAAGVSWWRFGRSDMFRVAAPLVNRAASLAFLPLRPLLYRNEFNRPPQDRDEHARAARFLLDNPRIVGKCCSRARLACITFSLLGAYCCRWVACRLYGAPSGLVALVLWCSCPYILGHASRVTADAHSAAFALAAVASFWFWLRSPDWPRAIVAGSALGLAQLSRFTLLILYPLFPVLWLVYFLSKHGKLPRWERLRQAGMMGVIGLMSVYVINLGYAFDGTGTRLGDFRFHTTMLTGSRSLDAIPLEGGNRFAGTWLAALPVPLPANMLEGIDVQRYDFERGLPSYLRGEWTDHGWWYYYAYALAIKMPLGTWCLVGLAVGATIFGRCYSASWRDEMVVLAPFLVILVFASSQTGFSVHSRYVIPALPFLFVWTSKVARVIEIRPFTQRRLALTAIVVLSLAWSVGSSLAVYPHSLSYFNELVGGPRRGGEHLLDSNIDWGQDLFYLKDWLDEHPGAKLHGLAVWGSYPATLVGIPETPYPPIAPAATREGGASSFAARTLRQMPSEGADQFGPKLGWYAISVNYLYGRDRQYRYFLGFQPVAMAGYSIYIYHITIDEANRVRRELGLPELPEEESITTEGGDHEG